MLITLGGLKVKRKEQQYSKSFHATETEIYHQDQGITGS